MTIKELIELEWQERCSKTSMPPAYVPKQKYHEKNANGLTKSIVAYIRLTGHYADRINNTGIFRNGKWTKSTTRKGIADIDATKKININGRSLGIKVSIEVKFGKDRMSEDQYKIKAEIEAAGGVYLIAKNFENFVKEWELIQ